MTQRFTSEASDNAVQANIVAAGYGLWLLHNLRQKLHFAGSRAVLSQRREGEERRCKHCTLRIFVRLF